MRVSDSMLRGWMERASSGARTNVLDSIQRAVGGQRVARPSDDPAAATRILRYSRLLGQLDGMDEARASVRLDLSLADTALLNVSSILGDVKALAVANSGDNPSAEDQAAAAADVRARFDQLLSIANQQLEDGRFLFGGLRQDAPPFAADGAYQGASGGRRVTVGPGVTVEGAITGAQTFGVGGEVFAAVSGLADALQAGDKAGIQGALDTLDGAIATVTTNASAIGSRLRTLDDTDVVVEDLRLQLTTRRADLQDVDIAAELTRAAAAQTQYEQVLTAVSRMLQLRALDFLG